MGKKEGELESLSQGSFIKYLLPLISTNPNKDMRDIKNNVKLKDDKSCPFRKYFIEDKDEVMYRIIFNLFDALKEVFQEEWNNPNRYILSKTTGYGAVLNAFNKIYRKGVSENNC